MSELQRNSLSDPTGSKNDNIMKSNTPEKDKYLAWFADAKKRGLISVGFTFAENANGADPEEIYAELNRMHDAPDLPLPKGF